MYCVSADPCFHSRLNAFKVCSRLIVDTSRQWYFKHCLKTHFLRLTDRETLLLVSVGFSKVKKLSMQADGPQIGCSIQDAND